MDSIMFWAICSINIVIANENYEITTKTTEYDVYGIPRFCGPLSTSTCSSSYITSVCNAIGGTISSTWWCTVPSGQYQVIGPLCESESSCSTGDISSICNAMHGVIAGQWWCVVKINQPTLTECPNCTCQDNNEWFIIGIVLICCFMAILIVLVIILYLKYIDNRNNKSNKSGYSKASNSDADDNRDTNL
eukprot:357623_1